MSNMVAVDIKTPHNEILEGSQLPLDYSVEMIIDELIDSLELARLDDTAKQISYILRSAHQGRTLSFHETVQTAQIRNGDTLELYIIGQTQELNSQNGGAQSGGNNYASGGNNYVSGGGNDYQSGGNSYDLPPTINTSEISIVLSVLDLNRNETVSLSVIRPIGELIRQIVGNYNLPARDNLQQPIKYKLHSKALGRFLDERNTLLEAQIPPLDRLTLHREEIAG